MDTFFFVRVEGQNLGPYLSFNDASIIMMDVLPEMVYRLGNGKGKPIERYTSEIIERVLAEDRWVDLGVRARDIRVLEVEI